MWVSDSLQHNRDFAPGFGAGHVISGLHVDLSYTVTRSQQTIGRGLLTRANEGPYTRPMSQSNRKLHKALERELKARGVTITRGSKHPKAKFPTGDVMILVGSASDNRSYLNQVARARRILGDPTFMRQQ